MENNQEKIIDPNTERLHRIRLMALEQAGKLPHQTAHELLCDADKIAEWIEKQL